MKRETTKFKLPEHERMDRELAVPKAKPKATTCICCGGAFAKGEIKTTVWIACVEYEPLCYKCTGHDAPRLLTVTDEEKAMSEGMPLPVETLVKRIQEMRRGYILHNGGQGARHWFDEDVTAEQLAEAAAARYARWAAGQPWPVQAFLEGRRQAA